jgi:hypothetical protein
MLDLPTLRRLGASGFPTPLRIVLPIISATIRKSAAAESTRVRSSGAIVLGLFAVTCFSLTLPATRAAVPELGATMVGLGRAIVAAALAAMVLVVRRERLPARKY